MRFNVPVRSIHTRPNRKYFPTGGRGAAWLNVVSDPVMGLGGSVMPGTLRDSLGILDAMFNLDGPVRPEIVITDTGSYSDLVFGLFAICGYQFSPRIADISDARLWRFDLARNYGPLQPVFPSAHPGRENPAELGGHAARRRVPADREGEPPQVR